MDTPGVKVQPLYQVLHEAHFGEIFLDDVWVPDAHVIGDVDNDWAVAMSTMEYERGILVLERQIGMRKRLPDLAEECRQRGLGDTPAEPLATLNPQRAVLRRYEERWGGTERATTCRTRRTADHK